MLKSWYFVTFSAALALMIPLATGCAKKEEQRPTRTTTARPAPSQETARPQAAAPTATAAAGSATITGKVLFEGTAPKMPVLSMDADPDCVSQHSTPVTSEEVVLNDNGTLRYALVYVKSGISGNYPPPATKVELDQEGCMYKPHVFAIQAGQSVHIVNSDSTLHNVQATTEVNDAFNKAMPVKGMSFDEEFPSAEPTPVRFKCQVHPWMTAYMGVFDHPFFAVTGPDGTFEIKNLPAGTYTLAAWQEKYGEKTIQIQVSDGEAKTADFTFGN